MSSAKYSFAEEIAHSVSHGIGAVLSVVGLAFLVWLSLEYGDIWHVISSIVYGVSLILLYSASTLYHSVSNPRAKRIFQLLDHSMIFVLIAGTYTPFALVSLHGPWGWSLFGVAWGIALAGILLETMKKERIKWLSLSLYLGMGWMAVIVIKPMLDMVPMIGLLFLLAGGLSYSLGVIFYVRKQMVYHHAIWHLFVMAGSGLHFCAVLFGVILVEA
ncbi:MAG: hemolysin III family protein [Idiomarina sp.]|nr:hemolysin III family protein [Idiomarina sp.]